MVVNTTNPGCRKQDKFTHACQKPQNVCGGGDFSQSVKLNSLGPIYPICQTGRANTTLTFNLKDGSGCDGLSQFRVDRTNAVITCGSQNIQTCGGQGTIGKECIWQVKLPDCSGEDSGVRPTGVFRSGDDNDDDGGRKGKVFKVGEMKGMNGKDRKSLVDSITQTDVDEDDNSTTAYCVAGDKVKVKIPPGIAGKMKNPQLQVDKWGNSVAKAVVKALKADKEGFEQLGLNWGKARQAVFLFAVDRLTTDGDLVTNGNFSFEMLLENVTNLVVKSYTTQNSEGVDVTSEGGTVTYLGNGLFRVEATHTSAFSGEIGTSSTSTSAAWRATFSMAGLMGALTLFALANMLQ